MRLRARAKLRASAGTAVVMLGLALPVGVLEGPAAATPREVSAAASGAAPAAGQVAQAVSPAQHNPTHKSKHKTAKKHKKKRVHAAPRPASQPIPTVASLPPTAVTVAGTTGTTAVSVSTVGTSTAAPVGLAFGDTLGDLSDADLAAALDDAVRLRASWIRIDLSWTRIQPTSRTSWSWSRTDRVVTAARQRGLHVLGILTYTPPWARAGDCTTWSCPPASSSAFAGFAGAAASRYASNGIDAFEIWNEPNLGIFWQRPDATAYARVLSGSLTAIHAVAPSAKVLFGGLAAVGTNAGNIGPSDFLQRVCSQGACAGIAAVSYHPYTMPYLVGGTSWVSAWGLMRNAGWGQASLQSVLAANGLAGTKIWVTEFGAPTGGTGTEAEVAPMTYSTSYDHVSEALQAQILASGFAAARSDPTLVGGFFVHTWRDSTAADREGHFGLRRWDGTAKPAWYVFQERAGS